MSKVWDQHGPEVQVESVPTRATSVIDNFHVPAQYSITSCTSSYYSCHAAAAGKQAIFDKEVLLRRRVTSSVTVRERHCSQQRLRKTRSMASELSILVLASVQKGIASWSQPAQYKRHSR